MKRQGRKRLTAAPAVGIATVVFIGLVGTPASAHVSTKRDDANLKRTFATADAVIHGVVSDVQYRMSTKQGEADESLPHTFVTYQVRSQLHGKVQGRTVTLRFIGGPDGSGRFLTVAGVPLFQKGHEDVLFIKGNGRVGCPLVNCEGGRVRIHQGRVYNARALPIVAVENNELLRTGAAPEPALHKYSFPTPSFENLMKRPEVAEKAKSQGDPETVKRRYEAEAPKSIEHAIETVRPAQDEDKSTGTAPTVTTPGVAAPTAQIAARVQRPPMAADAFLNTMKNMAQQAPKRPDQVASSVDPDKPFTARLPRAVGPKGPPGVRQPPRAAEKPEDVRERETLEQQDLDPVIKK